jgi:dolichol kinase
MEFVKALHGTVTFILSDLLVLLTMYYYAYLFLIFHGKSK